MYHHPVPRETISESWTTLRSRTTRVSRLSWSSNSYDQRPVGYISSDECLSRETRTLPALEELNKSARPLETNTPRLDLYAQELRRLCDFSVQRTSGDKWGDSRRTCSSTFSPTQSVGQAIDSSSSSPRHPPMLPILIDSTTSPLGRPAWVQRMTCNNV